MALYLADDKWITFLQRYKVLKRIKLRSFFFLFFNKALFTNTSKGFQGSPECRLCYLPETYNHLYWECPFTQNVWQYVFVQLCNSGMTDFDTSRSACMLPIKETKYVFCLYTSVKFYLYNTRIFKHTLIPSTIWKQFTTQYFILEC